jgi:hypothetical protein
MTSYTGHQFRIFVPNENNSIIRVRNDVCPIKTNVLLYGLALENPLIMTKSFLLTTTV